MELTWRKNKFCIKFDSESLIIPLGGFKLLYASLGESCILANNMKLIRTLFAIMTDCQFKKSLAVSIEHRSVIKKSICSSLSHPSVFEEVDGPTEEFEGISISMFIAKVRDTLKYYLWSPPVFYVAMYTKRENYTWEVYVYVTKCSATYKNMIAEDAQKYGSRLNTHTVAMLHDHVDNFEINTCLDPDEKKEGWRVVSKKKKKTIFKSRIEDCSCAIIPATFKVELKIEGNIASDLNHNFNLENAKQENSLTLTLARKGKFICGMFLLIYVLLIGG